MEFNAVAFAVIIKQGKYKPVEHAKRKIKCTSLLKST